MGVMVWGLSLPAFVAFGQALLAPGHWTEKDKQSITVRVRDSTGFRSAIQKLQRRAIIEVCGSNVFVLSNIDSSSFKSLRQLYTVTHIDRRNRVAREEAVPGDFDLTVNRVTALQALYPTVNGENLVLSVKEKPFDRNDIDFKGRVINSSHFDEAATLHATFMMAIAAGGGNSSPTALGAGWGAGLTTSDFTQLLPDLANELNALGVTVQNHSYGVGVENFYGIEAAEYDAQVYANPAWLHVFSSGNAG